MQPRNFSLHLTCLLLTSLVLTPAGAISKDTNNFERDLERALILYRINAFDDAREALHRLAILGDARSCFYLGEIYDGGLGVPRDRALAIKWYETAAKRTHATAMRRLGLLHIEQSPPVGLEWLQRAASAGDPLSPSLLADAHWRAATVSNLERAWFWFAVSSQVGVVGDELLASDLSRILPAELRDSLWQEASAWLSLHPKILRQLTP